MRISVLVLSLCTIMWVVSCGPPDEEVAPAYLEVEPEGLEFGAEVDVLNLILKNRGGETTDFTVKVAAEASGVAWLQVEPEGGVIAGEDAKALTVSVINRSLLNPGQYEADITIEATGTEPSVVPVSLTVGQPILVVEPADLLDFGDQGLARTLIIKNGGKGILHYSVKLPGGWVKTEDDLQKDIRANQPQTITLSVDRQAVPWYGENSAELHVSSNGLDDSGHSSTVSIELSVTIDTSCEIDQDCDKAGFFCDTGSDSGVCTQLKDIGHSCTISGACKSGLCVDEVCCQTECDGECVSCDLDGSKGECYPLPAGSQCDDGIFCTSDSSCQEGTCTGGKPVDCSHLDTKCSTGICDESAQSCVDGPSDGNWCVIDGECIAKATPHPDTVCQLCLPEQNQGDWTLASNQCLVDGVCYKLSESIGSVCMVCNPATPFEASPAVEGTLCTDDGNSCTTDECLAGECLHNPLLQGPCEDDDPCTTDNSCDATGMCTGTNYTCDDGYDCTIDTCDGFGGCSNTPSPGHCLIAQTCIGEGSLHPENDCMACLSEYSQVGWSLLAQGIGCNDNDDCTEGDVCGGDGLCNGQLYACGDGHECTADLCDGNGGCTNPVLEGMCLIDNTCMNDGNLVAEGSCLTCLSNLSQAEWSFLDAGMACDDSEPCTTGDVCGGNGICTGEAYSCEDELNCTNDLCDGTGGCQPTPIEGFCLIDDKCHVNGEGNPDDICLACTPSESPMQWSAANDNAPCDDEKFCTLDDRCLAGVCTGTPNACDEFKNQCTGAICVEAAKECKTWHEIDNTECDDADPCTLGDSCLNGVCTGIPKDCTGLAEGNPCKLPWCDPDSTPDPGICMVSDKENSTECDDGLFCVVDEICVEGQCLGTNRDCVDTECATGKCSEEDDQCFPEVLPEMVGTECDDGNQCTKETVCSAQGTCASGDDITPQDCAELLNNDNSCMAGICHPDSGCSLEPLENGAQCTADNALAQCLEGICLIVKCEQGWSDCNNKDSDGCESNVAADVHNCGDCNYECPPKEGAQVGCAESACFIVSCASVNQDCDGVFDNGCETDTSINPLHCGTCDNPCVHGDFFTHAQASCENSACIFLGCELGYDDANNTCGLGKSCFDGCETCQPLADGMHEIPDDGRDNDCDGSDTVNDESRGYYVNPEHDFGVECPEPGTGTRACPFKTLPDAVDTASLQDWSDPYGARREIYIAKGNYFAGGIVVTLNHPIMLLGGYIPTETGPWEREMDRSLTVISNESEGHGVSVNSPDGFAVLDGLVVRKRLLAQGKLLAVNMEVDPSHVETPHGESIQLWLQESRVGGLLAMVHAKPANFVVLESELGGFTMNSCSTPLLISGTTINGNLEVRCPNTSVMNSSISGDVYAINSSHSYVGNTIEGNFYSAPESYSEGYYFRGNTFHSQVTGQADWKFYNCTFMDYLSTSGKCALVDSHVEGDVVLDGTPTVLRNTIYGNLSVGSGVGAPTDLRDNYIEGDVHGMGHSLRIRRNVIKGDILMGELMDPFNKTPDFWTVVRNRIEGTLQVGTGSTVVGNTIYCQDNQACINTEGGDHYIMNNVLMWGAFATDTHCGILATGSYPSVLMYNAFFVFGGSAGALLCIKNIGNSISDSTDLNNLNSLADCGRGGNLSYPNKVNAEFLSLSPAAEGFLMPTADSPFTDTGHAWQYSCDGMSVSDLDEDLNGSPTDCDGNTDMGCYELCD